MNAKLKLSQASFIMGIISLVMLFFGFSVPFSAMGMLFALLSRDTDPLEGRAKTGFIMSAVSLILGIVITIYAIYLVYSGVYDQLLQQLGALYGEV